MKSKMCVTYLRCAIVVLLIGPLNAIVDESYVSSLNTPLSGAEALADSPLTEDNFTSVFPIVCIADGGCIEGRATPGFSIDEYESFFAIPYAEAPVGKLRFAVRESHENWIIKCFLCSSSDVCKSVCR